MVFSNPDTPRRADKENLRVSFEQQERVSKKQIAESNSALKSTQSETESMRMKVRGCSRPF
jgi:hypothetical protein